MQPESTETPPSAPTTEWHGFSLQSPTGQVGAALYIGRIPGRKQFCLYESPGPILAYFRNEAMARRALEALDRFIPTPGYKP